MARKGFTVGIDLGQHSVKYALIENEGHRIRQLWRDEILPKRQSRGEILENEAYRQQLFSLLKKSGKGHGTLANPVISAIQGEETICGYVELPVLPDKQIQVAVTSEAFKQIPFQLDEVTLSHVLVPPISRENGKNAAFFVAAKKNSVDALKTLLESCGLEIERLEVPALALVREFTKNHESPSDEWVGLVNIGFRLTHVVILQDGHPYFARDFPLAGRDFIYGFQMYEQSSWEKAEHRKHNSNVIQDEIAIQPFLERWTHEIRRSFATFTKSHLNGKSSLSKVFLSGGASLLNGLAEYLSQSLNLPVVVDGWDKLKYIGNGAKREDASLYKIAVGLALEN